MLIFPPFHLNGAGGRSGNYGYNFILNPPDFRAVVDKGLLLMQWLVVVTIGFIGWYILK